MKRIPEDERPIICVSIGPEFWEVGYNGVTRIEAYEEFGQMAMVPFIAIFAEDPDNPVLRFSAALAVIDYKHVQRKVDSDNPS